MIPALRPSVTPLDNPSQGPYDPPAPGSITPSYGPLIGDLIAPYALIMTGTRLIGTIIPEVVVEEVHTDETRITDHPVETGAAITDHAFMMPYEIQMHVGFSNSTVGAEGYVQMVYAAFQALQQAREPFDVSTGKRLYSNMLIQRMQVTTDGAREYALDLVVNLRQIIITDVQTTSVEAAKNTGAQSPQAANAPGGSLGTGTAGLFSVTPSTTPSPIDTTPVPPWEWIAAQPIILPEDTGQGIPQDYLAGSEVWV